MNVLLVDDEAIVLKGMMEGIDWKACGIDGEVYIAYSAYDAVKAILSQDIGIMLCDIEMPGENGIELLRHVHEINPAIVTIFLTCHAKFEYAQEAIRLGCLDYILKPAPYTQIEDSLKQAVSHISKDNADQEMIDYGKHWLKDRSDQSTQKQGGEKKNITELVEEAASYIINHLDDRDLTVTNLAKKFYLSEDYMNRMFKKQKQKSMNQYIIQERMKLAQKLLEDESLAINTIAQQVGYDNYPYFSSTFKRYFGCSPMQYRAQKANQF